MNGAILNGGKFQMNVSNVYEWMLINADRLVDAIEKDGKIGGPLSDPILEEAQRQETGGKAKKKAKELLQIRLKLKGIGHLMTW